MHHQRNALKKLLVGLDYLELVDSRLPSRQAPGKTIARATASTRAVDHSRFAFYLVKVPWDPGFFET